jgi:hypothetical protein
MIVEHTQSSNPIDSIIAIVLTAFAAVVSWQEQAEWAFRILSLMLASTVSVVVLFGHYKKTKKKR